ncbi:MAG: Crp/Fnr family transcriptional regulator [Cellulosilyticaceae bacterium]
MIEHYKDVLKKVGLFQNIKEDEIIGLVSCLQGTIKSYEDETTIFSAGDLVSHMGIVLEGELEGIKETVAGDRNIVAMLYTGDLFAEGIVCTAKRKSPLTVRTKTKSIILFIPYERVTQSCQKACSFHVQIIRNMLRILGEKNYALNRKMDYLILKGMREKIVLYLLQQQQEQESLSFNIKLNRSELAQYLNVSRSSMSRELARMKDEGLIDYYKNGFKIVNLERLKSYK